jgi:MerR family redox-sensitive transcriptional activator SoxR
VKDLAISDVARVFGLRTSAIRYYEQIGLLATPPRKSGQRRYDETALFRLAVIQRAQEVGFTLEEIRKLFFGFPPGTPPPKRWRELSRRKLTELRERINRLKLMETVLKRVENCQCDALDKCGKRILEGSASFRGKPNSSSMHMHGSINPRQKCRSDLPIASTSRG